MHWTYRLWRLNSSCSWNREFLLWIHLWFLPSKSDCNKNSLFQEQELFNFRKRQFQCMHWHIIERNVYRDRVPFLRSTRDCTFQQVFLAIWSACSQSAFREAWHLQIHRFYHYIYIYKTFNDTKENSYIIFLFFW